MNRAAQGVMLKDCLKRLRLPAMLRDYPECSRQAKDEGDSYEGFLLNLASRELEQRQANQLKRRLKEARFPVMKTLEKTDLKKWPGLDAMKVRDYASCDYITSKDNLVFVGRHGTGKSHAATVFGVEACRQGHRVAFTTAALLDRLTHRCHIHEFDWESIRLTESLQRQGKKRASQKSRPLEQADESS